MSIDLVISKSIDINSTPSGVWDVLTNLEMITQYFTGVVTATNWKVGSEIIFTHIYEEKKLKNKGIIFNSDPDHPASQPGRRIV